MYFNTFSAVIVTSVISIFIIFLILTAKVRRFFVMRKFSKNGTLTFQSYIWSGNVYIKVLQKFFKNNAYGSSPILGVLCFDSNKIIISGIKTIVLDKNTTVFKVIKPSNPLVSRITFYNQNNEIFEFYTLKTQKISLLLDDFGYTSIT